MGNDCKVGIFAFGNLIADFDIKLIFLVVFHDIVLSKIKKSGDNP
jgi:hypothetical protein